jgi:hypothetical protein
MEGLKPNTYLVIDNNNTVKIERLSLFYIELMDDLNHKIRIPNSVFIKSQYSIIKNGFEYFVEVPIYIVDNEYKRILEKVNFIANATIYRAKSSKWTYRISESKNNIYQIELKVFAHSAKAKPLLHADILRLTELINNRMKDAKNKTNTIENN